MKDAQTKHDAYLKFIGDQSEVLDRSVMWDHLSPSFITNISNGKAVLNNDMKQNYFVKFRPGRWLSKFDKARIIIANTALRIFKKIYIKFVGNSAFEKHCLRSVYLENPLNGRPVKNFPLLKDHDLFGENHCQQSGPLLGQWYAYQRIHEFLVDIENPTVCEIGADAGILSSIIHNDMKAKCIIVDLPEMISYGSACVLTVLPDTKILYPHEINTTLDSLDFDIAFLTPDMCDFIPDNFCDFYLNIASMGEMKIDEISVYFDLIHRTSKNGGYFYCSNRLYKRPTNMRIGDQEERVFFEYPWNADYEDILIDVDTYRLLSSFGEKVVIERLQKIVKS